MGTARRGKSLFIEKTRGIVLKPGWPTARHVTQRPPQSVSADFGRYHVCLPVSDTAAGDKIELDRGRKGCRYESEGVGTLADA